MTTTFRTLLIATAAAFASPAALAVDGVVLIDQNKAMAGNATPGDTPGFPVTITVPGSYRLASNLVVPNANTTAIVVTASAVTIDLNGFSIMGPTFCGGFPFGCSPTGSGKGISGETLARAVTVRNGVITGMGGGGVQLFGAGAAVENMTIFGNGGNGVLAQLGTITGNRILDNGLNGIFGGNAVISNNMISGNGGVGVDANDALITNNVFVTNKGVGVSASNSGYAWNAFSSNNGSFANPQFFGRTPIGPNDCDGNVCP